MRAAPTAIFHAHTHYTRDIVRPCVVRSNSKYFVYAEDDVSQELELREIPVMLIYIAFFVFVCNEGAIL